MADAIIGEIRLFAGTFAPAGWLICDGRPVHFALYQNLFSVIGWTFGGSDEVFNLPDLRGRVPVHAGSGTGLTTRKVG